GGFGALFGFVGIARLPLQCHDVELRRGIAAATPLAADEVELAAVRCKARIAVAGGIEGHTPLLPTTRRQQIDIDVARRVRPRVGDATPIRGPDRRPDGTIA